MSKADAEALSLALNGLIGAVENVRWWLGQVVEDYPARDTVRDAGPTADEVAKTLRHFAQQLEDLPRP